MNEKMIRDAYCRIRTIDQTIPDDVLDFMKDTALEKLHISDVNISFSEQELIDFVDWINTNYVQGKQGGYDWVEFDGETYHTTKSLLYKYLKNHP